MTPGMQLAAALAGLVGALLIDALARPKGLRSLAGVWLLVCQVAAVFGLFMALCGNVAVSVALTLACLALLVVASNAKHAMLGEPLVFSDLALVQAIFRHPQFYLSAVPLWQRALAGLAAALLLSVIVWFFVPGLAPHLLGCVIAGASSVLLAISLRALGLHAAMAEPRRDGDVARLGLTPSLMLYWRKWRESRDPPPCPDIARLPPSSATDLVIVIQCESFADPAELFGDIDVALPALTQARNNASQHGRLDVSGFGAYTMRTEYGVLFGQEESALGFRRYDPFLTALGEVSYALPARFGSAWRSLFVHPHDMRFYGRDRIMPAGGFAELIGEERFAPPGPDEGRYVTDAAMADEILELARTSPAKSLFYAVTIENHGPWAPAAGSSDLIGSYMRLVRHSDIMLGRLIDGITALQRPAMLVFFGDHRPSIPGATDPAGERHTPYVMLRFDETGRILPGQNRHVDLTPAGLHHAILDDVLGVPVT